MPFLSTCLFEAVSQTSLRYAMGIKMKLLYKLERKFGRYAIPNLMKYIVVLCGLGAILSTINPYFYDTYLILDMGKVMEGQVWRLFTFIIEPYAITSFFSVIMLALQIYVYLLVGRSLENAWGAFRFNLYFLSGFLFNILAAIILYIVSEIPYPMGLTYIYHGMFFAFAALYPNVQFLVFYIIPVKVKYLAYIYGAYIVWDVMNHIINRRYAYAVVIVVAMANFLVFFFSTRNYKKLSPREYQRKVKYKKKVRMAKSGTRHKCSICGKTELDGDDLEFRFCSRCDGNYEYCMEHLFSHEHVHKH